MNKFLNTLEKKFGKYAIPDVIKYFIVLYCLGALIGVISPRVYYQYMSLDWGMILKGQVWRLVTFVIEPQSFTGATGLINILFFFFKVNIFLLLGRSLEQTWGTFRFNMYFFSGIVLSILSALIVYLVLRLPYYVGAEYLYQGMFFAFALLYPDMQFLIYGLLPVKVKWLAILDAVLIVVQLFSYISVGAVSLALAIVVAFANFLIFFLSSRNYKRMSPKQVRRRKKFKKEMRQAKGETRHKCAICGRTELDDPNLEFRYCSKCKGNYEYCSDHLFTHTHIK